MDQPYRGDSAPATLSPNKKHCYACASILDVRAEVCPQCGVRQPMVPGMMPPPMPMMPNHALVYQGQRPLARSSRNKTTAGIFALLLGGLGIHKFYLGQTAAGIVYLLFFWTCIPALISFIEGILFLTMSDEAFDQRYPG
jgi:TM2 domain-containing membrane protein YozV